MVAPCLFYLSRFFLAHITQAPGPGETLIWIGITTHIFLYILKVFMLTYDMMGQNFCLGLFLTRYCSNTETGFLQTPPINPSDLDLRSSQEYESEHYKFYHLYRSIIWLIQPKSFCIKQANEMQTSVLTPHWYPYNVTWIVTENILTVTEHSHWKSIT